MFKKLLNYTIQGILYLAPISVTVYIMYSVFNLIDDFSKNLIARFFDISIPGIGILSLVLFLILIGFLGQTLIAKPLKQVTRSIIEKIPILNFIYKALNDLFAAFIGKEKKFSKPVLVKVNLNSDLEKLGFITEESLNFLDEPGKVAVYFPHSYNFSGELFIVPRENIKPLKANSSEVMKFIVSAGLTSVSDNKKETK
ncbi:DUF502 domain-containing protein [uncultured Lutibacter sp.]|uniref:DUF502 domain-containing protein n=1 Tax=uncultured Lutibacter sp. TaxID=437739 RepID=UPI0026246EB4|nr:DUF502 domain-containing protein [uncultured Lutibacter sp.]